jgi:uncharacterized protein YecE (DUF72 family)
LPPSYNYTEERLGYITNFLSTDHLNIIEFRHVSWWIPEVFEALAYNNLIFCSVSYPKLPEDIIKTSDVCYLRLHGRPKLFYSGYSDEELRHFYEEITAKDFREINVCFNNTASDRGILDAMTMRAISGSSPK